MLKVRSYYICTSGGVSPEIRISNGAFKLGPFAPRDVVEISIEGSKAQYIY